MASSCFWPTKNRPVHLFNNFTFSSDAWRRRRRRRRRRSGKMDESGIEMPEHHSQGLSADAERKFFADFFDEELEDEQNEYDVNNPGSSGITPSRKKKNTN